MNSIKFLIPLFVSYIVSNFCPTITVKKIPQSPPGYVFGIVWTLLYFCIGLSWIQQTNYSYLLFLPLIFLLNSWIYVFNCLERKSLGMYIISFTISTVIFIITIHESVYGKILLLPLLSWLIIAFNLNFYIIG
jgi:tryptophan-rich sensory protein